MSQTEFGPINITGGNSALFTAEFRDINGNTTVPVGASISVTYTNTTNSTQTDTITLSAVNYFFTGVWSSTSASPGLASWSITATGNSTASQAGQIRVIEP